MAIALAGIVGLAHDAIGIGPIGPGIIAAVLAVFLGVTARESWELETPLAASLFGMALASGFLASPLVVTTLSAEVPIPAATLHLHLARALASALAATLLLIAARLVARAFKALTGVLLTV